MDPQWQGCTATAKNQEKPVTNMLHIIFEIENAHRFHLTIRVHEG